jgi:glutamate-ammonia-ligase adenylyltransferase
LALLRQHFRHRIFAASARDIIEGRSVYESLASTSVALQDAIAAAFGIADAPEGLAVMALGSLGSSEFDVLSDADVLLVCAEDQNREQLTKSAERMMQALAAYTQQGMVSPVDARLRPRGGEGELLVTPAQLASYFKHEAQAWEALMYTKLRFLAGSRELAAAAIAASNSVFERFAADASFAQAVREMRTKLESSEKNFKTSPGAIYDIDFLCSFLLVWHGIADKAGNLRDRIWRCTSAGLLEKPDAATLDHAAELLRTVEHIVRLVVGRARKWLPAADHARRVTEKLAAQILNREFPRGLEAELEQTCQSVRKILERYLPSS